MAGGPCGSGVQRMPASVPPPGPNSWWSGTGQRHASLVGTPQEFRHFFNQQTFFLMLMPVSIGCIFLSTAIRHFS